MTHPKSIDPISLQWRPPMRHLLCTLTPALVALALMSGTVLLDAPLPAVAAAPQTAKVGDLAPFRGVGALDRPGTRWPQIQSAMQ
jgi:hypothetical protein